MVSVPSTAAVALTLLSTSLAAAVPASESKETSATSTRSHSETTILGHPLTADATITPTPSGTRPWYLDALSTHFIGDAVDIRSENVPVAVASSVAKHIIDDALSPAQYTSLAGEALQGWVNDGNAPNATSLYNLATGAYSAYQEIHNNLDYWSFVNYVQTTAASVFDVSLLQPTAGFEKLNGSASSIASRHRAQLTSLYSSLASDPSGKAALQTFSEVAESYYNDFSSKQNPKLSTGVVENLLLSVFNVF